MKGYWFILGTDITDEEAQQKYGKLWAPLAEKYQARLNPTKIPPMLKEARWSSRLIVVEFPSYQQANACYDDPAYQEARQFALRASKRELLIFEGELG